jgi:integrase
MSSPAPLDALGRRRSPATLPGYHAGRPPRNKGLSYPADPPRVEEIIAVMRQAGENSHGDRLRGLIVVLWRAGLRIHEALALTESDLDARRGALLVRHGKCDKRREVGMDAWGWDHLHSWLSRRSQLPVGRSSASSTDPHADAPAAPAPPAPNYDGTQPKQGYAGASRLTSCATPTRSRWPARASRSASSNANLATPTSASRRSTSKASTTPKSSTPSTHDAHR